VFFLFLLDARRFDFFRRSAEVALILPSSFCAVLFEDILYFASVCEDY